MNVLKFKYRCAPPTIQNYRRGSALLAVVLILAVVSSVMSIGTAKITQAAINSTGSNKATLQAQQFASSEADLIKSISYTDLTAQSRADISDSGFQREVILSAESDYSEQIKQKTATINVYKGSESLPRSTIKLTRYSAEQKVSSVPIGTVIAWASSKNPSDGVWLECNGQSCAAYSELSAVLGKTTVPDYRGRFLEGNQVAGTVKEAGLPNITGQTNCCDGFWSGNNTGALFATNRFSDNYSDSRYSPFNNVYHAIAIDASKSNSIYGNSTTVQPPSVTVRYFIKAA